MSTSPLPPRPVQQLADLSPPERPLERPDLSVSGACLCPRLARVLPFLLLRFHSPSGLCRILKDFQLQALQLLLGLLLPFANPVSLLEGKARCWESSGAGLQLCPAVLC